MLVTERQTEKGLLVAVCDEEILGQTFENGDISITVTEEFYGGDPIEDPDDVVAALSRASVANLVGTKAVTLAIEAGFVEEANVLKIDGTLHAQFMRL